MVTHFAFFLVLQRGEEALSTVGAHEELLPGAWE